jgi:hypothetical protein
MAVSARALLSAWIAVSASSCAMMPDLPPDWALPMQEVLLHSACELQAALRGLDGRTNPKQFDARAWTIKITLNPKVDADIQPGAGLGRRVPVNTKAARFGNFVLGTGNGATLDMKGDRTGSVDFKFDSASLIDDTKLPCEYEAASYHALTKYLGIRNWLYRSADAMVLTQSSIDNPSFSADVTMKFSGTGTYTYTFPPGTDLLSLSGFYQLDESLNINFTAKPKVATKFKIVSLPTGGEGFKPNKPRVAVSTTVTIFEEQQSTLQQIRQQLQNLRVVPQQ